MKSIKIQLSLILLCLFVMDAHAQQAREWGMSCNLKDAKNNSSKFEYVLLIKGASPSERIDREAIQWLKWMRSNYPPVSSEGYVWMGGDTKQIMEYPMCNHIGVKGDSIGVGPDFAASHSDSEADVLREMKKNQFWLRESRTTAFVGESGSYTVLDSGSN